jgi:putative phosphoesterase
MRVGILSDTHNQLERTVRAIEILTAARAAALIHCGDLTTPDIVAACAALPSYFVLGNNDADNVPALSSAIAGIHGVNLDWRGEVTLAGKRLGVVHGHFHRDVRRLLAARPDYLLYGHSHIADDRREEGVRWINPGALYRAKEFSVAVLDLATDQLEFLSVPR